MISLESAERALKDVYLGVLSDQLNNNICPILGTIHKTTNDVYGKEIIKIPNWQGYDHEYPTMKLDVVSIMGKIELSDKAIRVSQNSAGAFVNLLNNEVELMLREISKNIRNAFYDYTLPFIKVGETEITNPYHIDLCGIHEIFSNSQFLYGLERAKYKELNPLTKEIATLNPYEIQEIIDNHNDQINFMICSPRAKRKYLEINRITEIKEMGGFKLMLFNNYIPIITHPDIEDNVIYFIDSGDFKFHQLCDWQWLDCDGKVLKQNPTKPVYEATLVKYGNIICENPYKQIKIKIKE